MREISQLVCIYYAGLLAGKPQNLLLAYQKKYGKNNSNDQQYYEYEQIWNNSRNKSQT